GMGIGRMPYDAPLPNEDIYLLERWITGKTKVRDDMTPCSATQACPSTDDTCQYANGATTGNCVSITYESPALGAQCNPKLNAGKACFNKQVVNCNSDWNFGTVVETCPSDCTAGACL